MSTAVLRTVSSAPAADLAAQARRLADHPERWPVQPRFDADRRWYGRLAATDGFEAWLLTWLPGQATDLHDHGGSAGAFVVVRGALTEHTVRRAGVGVRLVGTRLAGGALRPFGADHVHRIVNDGTEPAVSVHVYAPALRSMTRYTLDGRTLTVESVSKAGEDW